MNTANNLSTITDNHASAIGIEAQVIDSQSLNAEQHFTEPTSMAGTFKRFRDLAATWEYNNGNISSLKDIVSDPAYQEIIGMGQKALPLILNELKKKPAHWFWALKSISGDNPVSEQDRGSIPKMIDAWLTWGQEKGYIK